ncbi:MAG: Rieske 2Fe-2S domain-containing protein [Ilumatobacteraceae bacterium]
MTRVLDGLIHKAEAATWLDGVADKIAPTLERIIPHGPVKDLASGTPLGHPLHPAIVAVPIGSWIGAAVLDLVGGRGGRRAAQTMVGLGALTALPAAYTGASDWLDTVDHERRVGLIHAALNTAAIGLFGVSWMARRRNHHLVGAGSSLLGTAIVSAAGFLGGHLAYGLGIGVDNTAFQHLPDEWTDVVAASELTEGKAVYAETGGVGVLLMRNGERIDAIADRCTHRGAPLHEGEMHDGCVTCPWHGSVFRLDDGSIERGPATRPQRAFDTRIEGDRVEVRKRT